MLSFIVTRENCFMVYKDVDKWTTFGSFSTARICLTRMTLNAEDNLPFSCQIFIRSNSTSVYRLQNSTYQMLTWVTLYNNFSFCLYPNFCYWRIVHPCGRKELLFKNKSSLHFVFSRKDDKKRLLTFIHYLAEIFLWLLGSRTVTVSISLEIAWQEV